MTSPPRSGVPISRDRLWVFGGYHHLRDYDSQPGTDPLLPATYEQDKFFGKLNWQINPGMQLMHSLSMRSGSTLRFRHGPHHVTRPLRYNAAVPTMTFGHLTHAVSNKTLYEVRAGRFVLSAERRSRAAATGRRRSRIRSRDGDYSGNPAAARRADAHSHDGERRCSLVTQYGSAR